MSLALHQDFRHNDAQASSGVTFTVEESLGVARQLLAARATDDAEMVCDRVLATAPENPNALFISAMVAVASGQEEEAIHCLEKVTQVAPQIPEPFVLLGDLLWRRGEPGHAAQYLQRAYELDAGAVRDALPLDRPRLSPLSDAAPRPGIPNNSLNVSEDMTDVGYVTPPQSGVGMVRHYGTAERVVFVADRPQGREKKLAAALRRLGWQVFLVYGEQPDYDCKDSFDDARQYVDRWQAVTIASEYDPKLYHLFCRMDYQTAYAFTIARPGKIVCDSYDNLTGMVTPAYPYHKEQPAIERHCLEQADGLVCRNLETQYGKRSREYDPSRARLFFPDYAWGHTENSKKLSDSDGELHLAFGGTVWSRKKFGRMDNDHLWIAKKLAENHVHFHLYPMHYQDSEFEDTFSEYLEFQEASPYFHLHRSVRGGDWISELAKYDVMAVISRSLLLGESRPQYTSYKARYAYSNKLADAVDAGLLYMSNPEYFTCKLAKRLGVGVGVAMGDLDDSNYWRRIRERLHTMSESVRSARQTYSIARHARRLDEYYQRICEVE